MAHQRTFSPTRLAAALLLAVAALAGCNGGGSTVGEGPAAGVPMSIRIYAAAGNPLAASPLSDSAWQSAPWHTLTGALDDPRSGSATRAAMLYDSNNLYVAFICEDEKPLDSVEVWLDSTAERDGKELVCASAKPDGAVTAAWYRNQDPPQPKADGSPDRERSVRRYPDKDIPGLKASSARGVTEGKPVWAVVVKIPLATLPAPLQTQGVVGAKWKLNLLRYDVVEHAGERPTVIQSNLAPIYRASQALSPYRMAEVELEGPGPVTAMK